MRPQSRIKRILRRGASSALALPQDVFTLTVAMVPGNCVWRERCYLPARAAKNGVACSGALPFDREPPWVVQALNRVGLLKT